jgi:hypothetical protein
LRSLGIRGEHVSPAAENGIYARGLEVDPVEIEPAELNVLDPFRSRTLAGDLQHALVRVAADQDSSGFDQLGRQKPGVSGSRRELEHALAGVEPRLIDHPGGQRHALTQHLIRVLAPAARGGVPVCALLLGRVASLHAR